MLKAYFHEGFRQKVERGDTPESPGKLNGRTEGGLLWNT
jgi:hypothetical protein